MSGNVFNLAERPNLRGIRRCRNCGEFYGMRAFVCTNTKCELHIEFFKKRRPFESFQLDVSNERHNVSLYSVRSKDKYPGNRNFVLIKHDNAVHSKKQHLQDEVGDKLKTQCFVELCRSDPLLPALKCKHIKSIRKQQQIPLAEVINVSREVLFNLNLAKEHKQRLWSLYQQPDAAHSAAVQRLLPSIFVVKCEQTKLCPIGRLHVNVLSNACFPAKSSAVARRKQIYSCTCKKLQLIVAPDNSVTMQDVVCDHLLLVLAGILSHPQGNFNNLHHMM